MNDISLYILDITQNSIKANAQNIIIALKEENSDNLTLHISDDGDGMDQITLTNIKNPFHTSRKTRNVGLGIPFLSMAAEQTGGFLTVESRPKADWAENHGTDVVAVFKMSHIDFPPFGDIAETVAVLIFTNPDLDFSFIHTMENKTIQIKTKSLREELGDVPLSEVEVYSWIKDYLTECYQL